MKYAVEQFVSKIKAPIIWRFEREELSFEDGKAVAAHEFDKNYKVDSASIDGGKVIITLCEIPTTDINSIGEEIISGKDWIKEHKERYGVKPNLFDGAWYE